MIIETGGPAFPVPSEPQIYAGSCGMDLRDFFAAKAMQAYITGEVAAGSNYPRRDSVAENAYAQADAMLKARKL